MLLPPSVNRAKPSPSRNLQSARRRESRSSRPSPALGPGHDPHPHHRPRSASCAERGEIEGAVQKRRRNFTLPCTHLARRPAPARSLPIRLRPPCSSKSSADPPLGKKACDQDVGVGKVEVLFTHSVEQAGSSAKTGRPHSVIDVRTEDGGRVRIREKHMEIDLSLSPSKGWRSSDRR